MQLNSYAHVHLLCYEELINLSLADNVVSIDVKLFDIEFELYSEEAVRIGAKIGLQFKCIANLYPIIGEICLSIKGYAYSGCHVAPFGGNHRV